MIKSLELHNFQSHKHSTLEFDPGMNVIIGVSDSGKTALVRALCLLVWNRPLGNAMRSTWGGVTQVITRIDDQSIIRVKEKSGDTYILDLPSAPQTFKAFGTSVPEEITQILNINEINLQQQFGRPFLLDDSPGEVAKHFNRIAHLDQIDKGIGNIQKWIRQIEQDISSGESRQTQLTEDLKEFVHLDKFEIEVEVLERMNTQMISLVNQKRDLTILRENIINVTVQINEQLEITKAEPLLDNILEWIEKRRESQRKAVDLRDLLTSLSDVAEQIEEEQVIAEAGPLVDNLLEWTNQRYKLLSQQTTQQTLIDNVTHTKTKLTHWKDKAEKLQKKFDKSFPDICPLCGKPK